MLPKKIRVALAGNPNSGKSTLFNALTGSKQHIANYPGVTVEKKVGFTSHKGYEIEVIDLPGTYSLSAYSVEELVARSFILEEKPDIVVDVVDASNLERNLYLFVQLQELGCRLIIALNMMDMAKARGIQIDTRLLSKHLGVRVVPMTARSGEGVEDLLEAIVQEIEHPYQKTPFRVSYGSDIDRAMADIEILLGRSESIPKAYEPRWLALKFLEGDTQIQEIFNLDPELNKKATTILKNLSKHTLDTLGEEPEAIIADHRYGFICSLIKECTKRHIEKRLNLSDRIDKILTNRLLGPVFMLLILYLIYFFIFWVSSEPINWLETAFDFLRRKTDAFFEDGVLKSLIQSGVIDGVGGILGYIPLIFFMFGAIAILEDSGYMARVAYMMDRVMRFFGLHGSSVISLIVSGGISGGCAVPGVLATRTLRDPKERLVTALVTPFMNCGGKLPVYAIIISAFFPEGRARLMFILTLFSWAVALFAARFLRGTVLKGPKSPFLMELPPYRLPTLRGLWIHSWERTWLFIKRAGTLILAFSIILWAGLYFPRLDEKSLAEFDSQIEMERAKIISIIQEKGVMGLSFEQLERAYEVATKEDVLDRPMEDSLKLSVKKALDREVDPDTDGLIVAYLDHKKATQDILRKKNETALKHTFFGRIGVMLETVTGYLGFDYKLNVALLSGAFAKELVVSTLGTAYSIESAYEGRSLEERLKMDPEWGPGLALVVLIFVAIYIPCIPTLLAIGSEFSYKWTFVSVVFNLSVAFIVAFVVRFFLGVFSISPWV